jgi:hypothetical protein
MKKVRSPAPSSFSTLLMGLARSTDKAPSEPLAHRYAQLLLQKSHDLRAPRKIPLRNETRPARYRTNDPRIKSSCGTRRDGGDYRLDAAPELPSASHATLKNPVCRPRGRRALPCQGSRLRRGHAGSNPSICAGRHDQESPEFQALRDQCRSRSLRLPVGFLPAAP